jgi:hypothetical protein
MNIDYIEGRIKPLVIKIAFKFLASMIGSRNYWVFCLAIRD